MKKASCQPYQYPLLVGAVPATGATQTVIKTATVTIPPNSKFVWLHTLNATLQSATGTTSVKIMLYDSIRGPLSNVPILITNMAGATFQTFASAPRSIRPFPLPEAYIFNKGAVISATYTIVLTPVVDVNNPAFTSVGIILCGYREAI